MAKKQVPVCEDKIIVVVDEKFNVYPKPVPEDVDPSYTWLGNFGISEAKTGKKLNGKIPKYQVLTEDREDKTLYFWSDGKAHPVSNQKKVDKNKKKYRSGELDLGDPCIGWD
jgi:hypothetical protein